MGAAGRNMSVMLDVTLRHPRAVGKGSSTGIHPVRPQSGLDQLAAHSMKHWFGSSPVGIASDERRGWCDARTVSQRRADMSDTAPQDDYVAVVAVVHQQVSRRLRGRTPRSLRETCWWTT